MLSVWTQFKQRDLRCEENNGASSAVDGAAGPRCQPAALNTAKETISDMKMIHFLSGSPLVATTESGKHDAVVCLNSAPLKIKIITFIQEAVSQD